MQGNKNLQPNPARDSREIALAFRMIAYAMVGSKPSNSPPFSIFSLYINWLISVTPSQSPQASSVALSYNISVQDEFTVFNPR